MTGWACRMNRVDKGRRWAGVTWKRMSWKMGVNSLDLTHWSVRPRHREWSAETRLQLAGDFNVYQGHPSWLTMPPWAAWGLSEARARAVSLVSALPLSPCVLEPRPFLRQFAFPICSIEENKPALETIASSHRSHGGHDSLRPLGVWGDS